MECPSSASFSSLLENPRAQGMPDARTHPQPCVQWKKARKQVTTGTPKQSGIPRANGVYGCSVLSPVLRACWPPSPQARRPRLDPSVGRSGPHGFAVRITSARLAPFCVHRIPLPTFVTIAIRPPDGGGMRSENHIFLKNGSRNFCTVDAANPSSLKGLAKLVFRRTPFWSDPGYPRAAPPAKMV
jgi:hypothetical protein